MYPAERAAAVALRGRHCLPLASRAHNTSPFSSTFTSLGGSIMRKYATPLLAAAVLALIALTAAPTPTQAHHRPGHGGGGEPPPEPPPVDVGWIYYHGDPTDDRAVFRVAPDGTENETVAGAPVDYGCPVPGCGGALGRPSHDTHDGSRWYVAHSLFDGPDDLFPNAGSSGAHGLDIDIIREGQATGITVLDASATCIWVGAYPEFIGSATGADTAITWPGAQWEDDDDDPADCESFVAAGMFRADLVYSGGAMVGVQAPVLAGRHPGAIGGHSGYQGLLLVARRLSGRVRPGERPGSGRRIRGLRREPSLEPPSGGRRKLLYRGLVARPGHRRSGFADHPRRQRLEYVGQGQGRHLDGRTDGWRPHAGGGGQAGQEELGPRPRLRRSALVARWHAYRLHRSNVGGLLLVDGASQDHRRRRRQRGHPQRFGVGEHRRCSPLGERGLIARATPTEPASPAASRV